MESGIQTARYDQNGRWFSCSHHQTIRCGEPLRPAQGVSDSHCPSDYWKTAVDELLWIWQKKSNNVHDLKSHIWDSWADETGSIGKAYGYQLGVKHHYKEGDFDQVDRILYDLKHNPLSRRIMSNIYNHHDLSEMHLYPCAYSMTFNVSGDTLNGILNQRSQDMLTANSWNVCQYAVLMHMFAQASGLKVGELVHVIADAIFMTATFLW